MKLQIKLLASFFLAALSMSSFAASIDSTEYQWNTNTDTTKHNTFTNRNTRGEYNDATGGKGFDINFLGTGIDNGQFKFGLQGGSILSGANLGSRRAPIFLSDIAINVTGNGSNPTTDSTGYNFAIRLLDTDRRTGKASFELLSGGTWEGADLYSSRYSPAHITETYLMVGGTSVLKFEGDWLTGTRRSHDNVLEGAFDLSLLGILDPKLGADIATYVTMACVNDEVMVIGHVSAVPVPAALWLMTPALLGFMGLRRRKKA